MNNTEILTAQVQPVLDIGTTLIKPPMGRPYETAVRFNLTKSRFRDGGVRVYLAGASGSGKTNLMAVIGEEVHGIGVPFLVIDPHSEYRSLTELPGVYCIGRESGDIPLSYPGSGWIHKALDLLARGAGVVVDIGEDLNDADQRVAYTSICSALLRVQRKQRNPMFLLVEEAHLFAPQKRQNDPESLAVTVKISREGRKWGINPIFASQRPRDLEADVASNFNAIFCGHVESTLDYRAIEPHLTTAEARGNGRDKVRIVPMSEMMALEAGEFYMRIGADLRKVKIRKRRTTHLGDTPEILFQQRQLFDLDDVSTTDNRVEIGVQYNGNRH